ncbi:MAG: Hsp20 family protein [Bryobacteraceae bacterium]|nr:Hsp20 family protein [Bryobacteraceae bacterium]
MNKVAIEKIKNPETPALPVFEEMREFMERVRDRAYELFEKRTLNPFADLEDWFRAEKEVFALRPVDLVEKPEAFHLRMAVPELKPEDIKITATPEELVVRTEPKPVTRTSEDKVLINEFFEEKTFRRIGLPSTIDVEKVTAHLNAGVLDIVAMKAAKPEEVPVPVKEEIRKAEAAKV